jgi:hypothetical protein
MLVMIFQANSLKIFSDEEEGQSEDPAINNYDRRVPFPSLSIFCASTIVKTRINFFSQ